MRTIIKSQEFKHIKYIHNRSLIYGVREQSISQDIGSARENTARQCIQDWGTHECSDGQEQEVRLILNRKQGQDFIASKFECGMEVPVKMGFLTQLNCK